MPSNKLPEAKIWNRPASCGEGLLLTRLWAPKGTPKAILQISHGMSEHSGRYDEFATILVENGYIVCAEDHAGHGPNAKIKGFFAKKDGWGCVVKDMKGLMDEVHAQYPNLPLFLFGYSMGSLLARAYITLYGDELSGCILAGTMGPNPALGAGKAMAGIVGLLTGKQRPSYFLGTIALAGTNKRAPEAASRFSFLTTMKDEVVKYDNDPDCGFTFTPGGYYDLFSGMCEVNTDEWAKSIPKNLPVYLYSGADDPFGGYGKGVGKVYKMIKNAGVQDVELKVYPFGRHELHHETNRQEVFADVISHLDKWLAG
ncbi:alpha/beta hydrolase [Spirochaetia bacterium]|nr:alpha/beta hydrolase [Spirochaetia bacterium]